MIIRGASSNIQHLTEVNNDILGKDDFLKLLTAQLSHQDPMEPLDNNEFIAQMTQFSSLEKLENINASVDSELMLSQSMNNALSTTLIGRNVILQSNVVDVTGGESMGSGFYTDKAGTAFVTITDSNGETVRTLNVDVTEKGFIDIEWDAKDNQGNDVSDGEFYLSIEFTGEDGVQAMALPFLNGRVTSLKFYDGNAYLTVGGHEYNLAQVIEISE
ncbi:MAG: hypothetical protein JW814_10320 [Candidatus Krumholzibacteriota bacterium]|nr:hypothetical protein [Candidatus Krumholzibacteriota bacterium]